MPGSRRAPGRLTVAITTPITTAGMADPSIGTNSPITVPTAAIAALMRNPGDSDALIEPPLVELRVFAAAARHGSFSGAARELGITQQAVSARARALERSTGVQLFARSPQGVTLTDAGATVLPRVTEVLDAANRLRAELTNLGGTGRADQLIVGASQTIAAHLLPGWLVTLRRQQEGSGDIPTSVQLHTCNSADVIGLVRSGAIELGLIETPDVPTDLGHAVVGSDPLVIAVAPGHPWASRAEVSLAEVAETPLVTREPGSGTRLALEQAVAARPGLAMSPPAVTLATEAAVRTAAARGIAPAIVSVLSVSDDVRLGRIVTVPISGEAPTRPLTAIWRGGRRDLVRTQRQLVAIAATRAPAR